MLTYRVSAPCTAEAHPDVLASVPHAAALLPMLMGWVEKLDVEITGLCWQVYVDPSVPVTDLYAQFK